jgi:hypothetical protein
MDIRASELIKEKRHNQKQQTDILPTLTFHAAFTVCTSLIMGLRRKIKNYELRITNYELSLWL